MEDRGAHSTAHAERKMRVKSERLAVLCLKENAVIEEWLLARLAYETKVAHLVV